MSSETIYIAHRHRCDVCNRAFPCIEPECNSGGATTPGRCYDCKRTTTQASFEREYAPEQPKLNLEGDITFRKSRGHENSMAAHKKTDKQRDCERVLDFLRSRGWEGATCEELSKALDMPYQTASGRCAELKGLKAGSPQLIVESGRTRLTTRGAKASVLILKRP